VSVDDQIVSDMSTCFAGKLLKLHPVKQSLVDRVGNTASKGRGVIVLFDLPNGDGIDKAWERAINMSA